MPISPLHFPTDAQLASTTSLLDVPAPREVSEWLRYDRPAEYESLGTRVEVPTRDGTVLVGMLSIGAIGWLTSGCVELVGRRLTRWLSSEQRSAQ